jgi:AraC-like DNA-binding protein
MDVLSDVLQGVRLTGAVFFEMEAHSPWVGTTPSSSVIAGLVMPEAEHVICFHILMAGTGWATLADNSAPPLHLNAGDVVVVSKGDSHFLSSSPGMRGEADLVAYHRPPGRALPVPHILNETASGTEVCHFVCGYLGCDLRPFNPLLHALPRMLHGQASQASQGWLSNLLRTAVDQTEDHGAGREIMLSKLAELIFVDVLRRYVSELPDDGQGWLSGLKDRHVGTALRLMHEKPAEDWSLETLARNVGLSRSTFAQRFTTYVGAPPIEYLGRWRMQLAARLLDRGASIAQTASQVGYGSEAAFSRVFKRFVGMSPGTWRRGKAQWISAEEQFGHFPS